MRYDNFPWRDLNRHRLVMTVVHGLRIYDIGIVLYLTLFAVPYIYINYISYTVLLRTVPIRYMLFQHFPAFASAFCIVTWESGMSWTDWSQVSSTPVSWPAPFWFRHKQNHVTGFWTFPTASSLSVSPGIATDVRLGWVLPALRSNISK